MSTSPLHIHVRSYTQSSQEETQQSPDQLWERAKTPLHSNQRAFRMVLDSCQVRAYIRTVLLSKEYQANPQKYIADWEARNPQNYPQCCALAFFSNSRIAMVAKSWRD